MVTSTQDLKKPTVGVAFLTHNAKHHLSRSLPPFLTSPLNPRVVVVNSSSQDGTVEQAEALGAETLVIPRKDFNHGSTRELARKYLGTDIVVMVTPDAYATGSHVLEQLIDPIIKQEACISYARQLPHEGAKFFEAFPREFNYPKKSQLRGIEDVKEFGIYTFFCSNSCAAYSNAALEKIGGFQPVLLGEDTVAVAKLLKEGHKIAYVADANVHHSHHYSLLQEFRRLFDTGLARKEYQHLISIGGSDSKRGKAFVKEMTKRLAKEKPHLLPYAFAQTMAKWFGYKMGRISGSAPLWVKKMLSSQDFYWESNDFLRLKNKK